MDWISQMNQTEDLLSQMRQEAREIAIHRGECSAARSARGDRHLSAEVGGCYFAEDGWWISCPQVFEIMRSYDA